MDMHIVLHFQSINQRRGFPYILHSISLPYHASDSTFSKFHFNPGFYLRPLRFFRSNARAFPFLLLQQAQCAPAFD